MSNLSEHMQALALRLVSDELDRVRPQGVQTPPPFLAYEKLRPALSMLLGKGGFRALISRAVAMAAKASAPLKELKVLPDGSVEGWDVLDAQLEPAASIEARVLLLAHLLQLLVTFIGTNLTLGVVREVWPNISFSDFETGNGD